MVSAGISYDTPAVQAAKPRLTLADCFVVVAIGLVATAVAVGLIAQFSVELVFAVAVASIGFIAMMAGHIGLRRANRRSRDHYDVDDDASQSAESLDRRPMSDRKELHRDPVSAGAEKNPAMAKPATERQGQASDMLFSAREAEAPAGANKDAVALQDLDLGNFRPRSPADLTANPAKTLTSDSDSGGNIDEMIRRLADDIEAGRKPTLADAAQSAPMSTPPEDLAERSFKETTERLAPQSAQLRPPPLPTVPIAPSPSPMQLAPTMIEAATPPAQPAKTPAPPPSATAKLAAIADALSDEHLEVCLETINDLEDYRAQHYEVSVRLQLSHGEVLDNDAFIAETRGTGLLPLLEAVKVSSTKRLAVQMMRRGRTGEFFSAVDGEALSDRQFSEDVDTIIGGDPALASRLVLAFSQADVRGLTPAQLFTLDSIAALGFRFSVEDIFDLDMDFELLARRGFVFAKLDAEVFLSGLPIGTTRVPAQDICRHLGKAGLALIVGKINDETARAKILGFGAVLGQGLLFGSPRPVRADVLRPSEQRPPVV